MPPAAGRSGGRLLGGLEQPLQPQEPLLEELVAQLGQGQRGCQLTGIMATFLIVDWHITMFSADGSARCDGPPASIVFACVEDRFAFARVCHRRNSDLKTNRNLVNVGPECWSGHASAKQAVPTIARFRDYRTGTDLDRMVLKWSASSILRS